MTAISRPVISTILTGALVLSAGRYAAPQPPQPAATVSVGYASNLDDLRRWDAAIDSLVRTGGLVVASRRADRMVEGRVHEYLVQYVGGVRVIGGGIARQFDRGVTVSLAGTVHPDIGIDTAPALSAAAAGRRLEQAVGAPLANGGAPAPAQAQETGRMLLEGGIVGGNSIACPGHYVGVEGHIRYGVSAWGMVENYRCDGPPQTSSRAGLSLMLARDEWRVRPALRSGLSYDDDGSVSPTVGASLTLGHQYGARFIVDRWTLPNGAGLVLMQVGAFFSF